VEIDADGGMTGRIVPAEMPSAGELRDVVICDGPFSRTSSPMRTTGNACARRFLEEIFPAPEMEYRYAIDAYIVTLAPLFGGIRGVTEPLGCYRIHGSNHSRRMPLHEKVGFFLELYENCSVALQRHLGKMGISVDREMWKSRSSDYSWAVRLRTAMEEIKILIPERDRFVLVDDGQWGADCDVAGRHAIPFLERKGQYWGRPADDASAIVELERLRQEGASFVAFAWPAFWWLGHYTGLHDRLRATFRCVLENQRLIVFDLRTEAGDVPG